MLCRHSVVSLALFAVSAVVAVPALAAEEIGDRYVSGYIGAGSLNDLEGLYSFPTPSSPVNNLTIGQKTGYSAGLIFGMRLSETLRGEVELSYATNDIETWTLAGFGTFSQSGDTSGVFGLVNLWYDIPVAWAFKPYVGGGLGFGRVSIDSNFSGSVPFLNDSDSGFAAQVGFGGRIPVGQHGVFDIGYRYKSTTGLTFSWSGSSGTVTYQDMDYKHHSLNAGYSFLF